MKTSVSCKGRKPLRLIGNTIVLATLVLLVDFVSSAQRINPPSSTAQDARFSGVKFTVAKGFTLEETAGSGFAFMRHQKEPLGLFVSVPNVRQIDDQYLTDLSNKLVSRFLPQKSGFEWKMLRFSNPKYSAYQTTTGAGKGLKDLTYVQTDFVIVKAQKHDIVIGSISVFDATRLARHMFDVDGREYSFTGWAGVFEVLASITGEKHAKTK